MPACDYSPYVLPTIDFVGGSTQDLLFNVLFCSNKRPFSLEGCVGNFAIVNFLNRTGAPIVSKTMSISIGADGMDNKLLVTLDPEDTVDLAGKYIYQITIKDADGDVEIPKQGIMYITNNINKSYIA